MRPRVVFDTNVLFSAVGWGGTPGQCVQFAQTGRVTGITCAEILEELTDKLSAKLRLADDQIDTILASLMVILELVQISGSLRGLQPDPKDDMILECALAGSATHIVTGDQKHLLPLRRFRGIDLVTPAEMVQVVQAIPEEG
jgi:putative PIN family toxin of toxin-antitoxin system